MFDKHPCFFEPSIMLGLMYMSPAKRKRLEAQVAQAQGNNLGAQRCNRLSVLHLHKSPINTNHCNFFFIHSVIIELLVEEL